MIWKKLDLRWNDVDRLSPGSVPFDPDSLEFTHADSIGLASEEELLTKGASGIKRSQDTFKFVDRGMRIPNQREGWAATWLPVFLDGDFEVSVVADSFDLPSPGQNLVFFRFAVEFDHPGQNLYSIHGVRRAADSKIIIRTAPNVGITREIAECEPGTRFYLIRRGDRLHFMFRSPDAQQTTGYLGSIAVPTNAASRVTLGIHSKAGLRSSVVWRDLRIRSESSIGGILDQLNSRVADSDETLELSDTDLVADRFDFQGANVSATEMGIETRILSGDGPSTAEARLERSLAGDFDVIASLEITPGETGGHSAFLQVEFSDDRGNCSVRLARRISWPHKHSETQCLRKPAGSAPLTTHHGCYEAYHNQVRIRLARIEEYIHIFVSPDGSDQFYYRASHYIGTGYEVSQIKLGVDRENIHETTATWKQLVIRSWDIRPK